MAQGYAVLWPRIPYDPRTEGDPVDLWPLEVLAAIEAAVRQGFTDPDRPAAMGESFRGLAVLQLLSRTARFRCAVVDSAIADVGAYFGDMAQALDHPERGGHGVVAWCEIGQGGMGAPPWERPERYVAHSPVYALDRIHTPLLLLAGDREAAVPWTQSAAVYVGLNRLRRTRELSVYRGEGHTVPGWGEANRRDAVGRILGWLATHVGAGVAPARM